MATSWRTFAPRGKRGGCRHKVSVRRFGMLFCNTLLPRFVTRSQLQAPLPARSSCRHALRKCTRDSRRREVTSYRVLRRLLPQQAP